MATSPAGLTEEVDLVALAQVHATLAHAGAIVEAQAADQDGGEVLYTESDWYEAFYGGAS